MLVWFYFLTLSYIAVKGSRASAVVLFESSFFHMSSFGIAFLHGKLLQGKYRPSMDRISTVVGTTIDCAYQKLVFVCTVWLSFVLTVLNDAVPLLCKVDLCSLCLFVSSIETCYGSFSSLATSSQPF